MGRASVQFDGKKKIVWPQFGILKLDPVDLERKELIVSLSVVKGGSLDNGCQVTLLRAANWGYSRLP